MKAPDIMHVYIHDECDNVVAYQNIPVHSGHIDKSDGRQWTPVRYVREDRTALQEKGERG